MEEPLALKWGPTYYNTIALSLIVGLAALVFHVGVQRPLDIAVVSIGPLLLAGVCLLCSRQLLRRRVKAVRLMKFVWAASIGMLAHGTIGLALMGLSYLTGATPAPTDVTNLKFVIVEIPLGLLLVVVSARMFRSAKQLVSDGVLT